MLGTSAQWQQYHYVVSEFESTSKIHQELVSMHCISMQSGSAGLSPVMCTIRRKVFTDSDQAQAALDDKL